MTRFLRTGAVALAALTTLGACAGLDDQSGRDGDSRVIKVGFVTPQTGPLAAFGEADDFVIDQMREHFRTHPVRIGADDYSVEIVVKDAASDSKRAGEVAGELINSDQVDLVMSGGTPDVVNPVADQCEANGVPCITTSDPWQPYFFGRGGTPGKPFRWTYHFFWGLEDVEAVYLDMWSAVSADKKAGALWPNDPDGRAWGDQKTGFSTVIAAHGYSTVDPGFYPNGTQDFTAQIARFKADGADILLGVPIPPDFTTFWTQAKQQGYRPKLATIGKALLFPSSVEALGDLGDNLATEVWWHPTYPYKSSLTGQSAADLAAAYEKTTGRQWIQPIGFTHALFEVMVTAYARAGSADATKLIDALKSLKTTTIVGPLDWTAGPVPNVAKTPLVGGQWRKSGGPHPYELVIVSNSKATDIPTGGRVEALR
ncbi:ABC transporter substrate-binding protein [Kibdelosporangium aridum]|uniref:ABC transporter substrate-binding protein n=1 Tax=Kibdelosporangium aridum TaxID=2030 RepID=UPI0035E9C7DC